MTQGFVGAPMNLVADYSSGFSLIWDGAPEEDFAFFRIYRGLTFDFVADASNFLDTPIAPAWSDPGAGSGFYYKVSSVDDAYNESETASPATGTGVPHTPRGFALHPNAPNPFNPRTEIRFELAQAAKVELHVFDLAGRRIATLIDERLRSGEHSTSWQGRDDEGHSVASGVYLYRLIAEEKTQTRRMVLLK